MVVVASSKAWPSAVCVLEDQGARDYMEDRHTVVSSLNPRQFGLIAVFDGHGGAAAADYCSRALPPVVLGTLSDMQAGKHLRDDVPMAIARDFHAVDTNMQRSGSVPQDMGTTACVVAIGGGEVWAANTGDSRAIMRSRVGAVQLTRDHKPTREDEMRRITDAGGRITYAPNDTPRIMGTLNLSRSLGDWYMRPYVIPTPEVSRCELMVGDAYLLVASDGIWDVITDEDEIAIVDARLDDRAPKRRNPGIGALRELHDVARNRGSTDNVTAVLLDIRATPGRTQ